MPELLSRSDAAQRLKVSTVTVDRLITSGKLKSFKIGKIVKIREQDIIDFINSQIENGKTA